MYVCDFSDFGPVGAPTRCEVALVCGCIRHNLESRGLRCPAHLKPVALGQCPFCFLGPLYVLCRAWYEP